MTEQETQQILKVLKTNYPNSFKSMSSEESYNYLSLWHEAFKNNDVILVIKAVKEIIYTDTREFAPNIAQVKSVIAKYNTSNLLESKQSLMKKYDNDFDDNYDYREDEMICLILHKMKDAQGDVLAECKHDFNKVTGHDYDTYMQKIFRKEVELC
ncbi:replicative helicase loader/inhibitor [Candidatus Stoquefichus sp. SB1]|uniref:replicative helicase loader/inhibitor n=1 Tax=Candidatus Stoquefichus sp. SB1 TaxID=1658109 RepID=UPI00067E8C5B|nr:replicative helicase loader/inhibitor [Candidatus Stoquefichus sp. SB1]